MVDLVARIVEGRSVLSLPGQDLIEPLVAAAIRAGEAARPAPALHSDIMHFFSYGQSLSCGIQSTPPISTAQRFDNIMPDGGVRTAKDGGGVSNRTAFVPLVESSAASISGGPAGETPMSGVTEMIKELLLSENSLSHTQHSYQLLATASGFPALTITQLSKGGGSLYNTNLVGDLTAAASLAAAAGKTIKCLGFIWMQGESDVSNTGYDGQLVTMRTDVDTDVKAAYGQSEDVFLFTYGGQEMNIALEINQAAVTDPKIIIIGPMYAVPHYVDGIHLSALGEKLFGAYAGRAFKRTVIDGEAWSPVKPIGSFRQGKLAEIKFHVPKGPLVFDTASYAAQTSMGFRLYQADGTTAMTISAVDITQPDVVRIRASANIPSGAVLRYGIDDPTAHTAVFGGNLRDSDQTVFDGGGLNLALPNWCQCFERVL